MPLLIALTIFLAPTYIVRFSIGGLPLNLLMVWIVVLWIIVAIHLTIRKNWKKFLQVPLHLDRRLLWLVVLFLLSGIISLFVGGISQEKIGQFIVLFIQPLSLFWIVRHYISVDREKTIAHLKTAALIFVAVAGVYAVVQYFTLIGVPMAWWGNANEPKRAVAFFIHPNFYSLFITPLLAFLLPEVLATRSRRTRITAISFWIVGVIGLLFSLSRGGWLGLLVALAFYVIIRANKRLIISAVVGLVVIAGVVSAVPNLRYRILLPFHGEKSSVARFSLWQTGWKMVKDSPILGKGLLGFSNSWYKYNSDPNLDHYPAPHNIILNFWIDTGLLGLISFAGLWIYGVWAGIKQKSNVLKIGLALFLIAIAAHGIIDIPYFKNDLALIFWMVYALAV